MRSTKKITQYLVLALTLSVSFLGQAMAAKEDGKNQGEQALVNSQLLSAREKGVIVEQDETLPKVGNLIGWSLHTEEDGKYAALYTTPDQEYVIDMKLMNEKGADPIITWIRDKNNPEAVKSLKEEMPANVKSEQNLSGDVIWDLLSTSTYLRSNGNAPEGAPIMYAFFDINCPNCAKLWPLLEKYKTTIEFRIIPVNFIKENGIGKWAWVFGSAKPYEALAINEKRFEDGGLPAIEREKVDVNLVRSIALNTHMMNSLNVEGTPVILYWDETSGKTMLEDAINEGFFIDATAN